MTAFLKNISGKAGSFCSGLSFFSAFLFFYAILLLRDSAFLFSPPHWDEIIGVHNQALFLLKHNFNFTELWTSAQHCYEGSNVYPLSLIPVLYASLYAVLPPEWVHFAGHLLNHACIAGSAACFFLILREKFEQTGTVSLLWSLAFLAEPLLSGRAAALDLDAPMICAISISFLLVSRKKYFPALAVLIFSGFLKPSSAVVSLAFLLIALAILIRERREWREHLPVVIGAGVCFLILFLMTAHHVPLTASGIHSTSQTGVARDGGNSVFLFLCRKLIFHYELYFPVLLSVMIVGAGLCPIQWLKGKDREKCGFQLLLLLTSGGYVLAYLIAKTALPRYLSAAVFPAYLLLASNWKWKAKPFAILLILIGLTAPCFYKPLPFGIRRSGEYLERSRAFLYDIAANRRLCSFLETYRDHPIVAPWPIVQMLTMPEMGYVKSPFPKVYSSLVPFYAPVKKLDLPLDKMPDDTIFVYQENDWETTCRSNPCLRPGRDTISIWKDSTLGGLTLVYRRNKF